MLRLLCKVVGHKRKRQRVRSERGSWRTDCTRCGTPLVKTHNGRWLADRSGASRD